MSQSTNVNFSMDRWEYPVKPTWTRGQVFAGPLAAGTTLLEVSVSPGHKGYIWGYSLAENDPNGNVFLVRWVSGGKTYQQMILIHGPGAVEVAGDRAINDGSPADPGTSIVVQILHAASADTLYSADILWGQVPLERRSSGHGQ
ncbi:MAG: hypothetical protein RXO24_03945 [Acidilobus sp.]